ncbi:uncharacterized protein LOC143353837 [Halictus rubicundus]|uniref:uncharacterized protein LOC143353837 n=1 Tax=Halictus rubicundus TaxID=77578 RepID=UPI0040368908
MVALPFNENKVNLGEIEYHKVINEYLALGHLSPVETPDASEGFYLPHHAVVKLASSTTKVRIVFDAPAKSSTGYSLNDALLTGPTIQDDIFNLLIRFHMHRFVLTGDIEKSTRCLQQLAEDEAQNYITASEVIKRDIYVDDLLTGADTFEKAQALRQEITDLLQRGGLNIRQRISNDPRILTDLSKDQVHPKFFGDESVKTLGISWNPHNDTISYSINISDHNTHTKRIMLSIIAKIFDPLGLLGPEWCSYQKDLKSLEGITFKRHVAQGSTNTIELHGFCDASEQAYGACFYIRTVNRSGRIKNRLLCAKSRVAPLKTISLARLELCVYERLGLSTMLPDHSGHRWYIAGEKEQNTSKTRREQSSPESRREQSELDSVEQRSTV